MLSRISLTRYSALFIKSVELKRMPSFYRYKRTNNAVADKPGTEEPPVTITPAKKITQLDLSFNNAEEAFKSKYNSELVRAYFVYLLCSSSFIVNNNLKLMNLSKMIVGKKGFEMIMKITIYGHFVAGEDRHKIIPCLERLIAFGVYPVLDYSVEEDLSEQEAVKREFEGIVSEVERKKSKTALSQNKETLLKPSCSDKDGRNIDVTECPVPQYNYQDFGDRRKKVCEARTYFYLNEEICDRNLDVSMESIEIVGSKKYGPGVAAVKLTALGRPQLLMQLSEVIVKARKFVASVSNNPNKETNVLQLHLTEEQLIKGLRNHGIEDTTEFIKNVIKDDEGVMHLFPWFGIIDQNFNISEAFRIPSLKDGKMVRLIKQLTDTEEQMFRNFIKRLNSLFTFAKELNVPVMVDAEQTYFQPAISRITMEMMHKYNTDKHVVLNTYQCYLKDAFNEVQNDLEQSRRENFYFGAKIVRGAYLHQERERAATIGYADPTCENFEATTQMLTNTFDEFMKYYAMYREKGQEDRVRVMLASHNEDSVKYVIQRMKEMEISPWSGSVFFGQLLGMCDFISFPLGQSGYLVYKYVPYGPVGDVIPYLSRRVIENKGVLKKVVKEKRLLLKELMRRFGNGQFNYKPNISNAEKQ